MTLRLTTLALLLAACGGGASGSFGPMYPDNQQSSIDSVLGRLQANPAPSPTAVAVGLTGAPHQLYAVDLETGAISWKVPVDTPASGPQIGGDLVFLHETRGVVARDLASGAERFVVEDDALHLAGAGGEGDWSVLALTTGGGVGARSKLVIARRGSVKHDLEIPHALGAPTVAAGMVFVPWATQNLTVLDAVTADEIARVRVTDTSLARAFRVGNDLYFGQRGVFRLTPSIVSGARAESAYFEPMAREIPGNPTLMVDPYRPAPTPDSAVHSIRFAWRPAGSGETLHFADETVYAVFYRFVFALDPNADAVRWVYAHPEDIVGAVAQDGGLTVADEAGGLAFLGAQDGLRRWSASVDATPTVVAIRPGDHVPTGAPEGEAMSLHDQLLAAAQNTDARLVPARKMAVHMLHALEEPDVTAHLITLCDDQRAPAPVRTEACGRLAERTTGAEHVIAALERHDRYLTNTEAGPIGALAQAAVAMEATEAAPSLIAHLVDPSTPAAALAPLLDSLRALEAADAAEPVRNFLRLYHAEVEGDAMLAAMSAAAQTALALDADPAVELLETLSADSLAPGPVRGKLTDALEAYRAAQAEAEAAEGEEETEEAEEGEEAEEEEASDEPPPIPERVTLPMVQAALEDVRTPMAACLANDSQHPRSARIVLVLAGDGSVQLVTINPQSVQQCLEPLIRSADFPANSNDARQQLTYTFRR
ncbi:MAG: PQQ-binding-like beta-propeller repeat protein [Deltaproteobacteria bacterium]|nr:PQQ-binding-like beta-propeller repeat protein [Deltaproteobacteria bacterium]